MKARKTVGVLGGMGPMATVEFFRRVVVATPAETDQEHLRILIDNDPRVPNRTDAILHRGPSPVPRLQAMARWLEAAGADLLVMPCNTAHIYIEEVRASVSIPVLDMIFEAVAAIDRSSVGLLATDGTIAAGLYREACEPRGVRVVVPNPADQRSIMDAIASIKRGENPRRVEKEIKPIVCRLERGGAEAVIAGCTEMSLVPGDGMPLPWIDALDCLVEATLRDA
jgi:aspartate racemase